MRTDSTYGFAWMQLRVNLFQRRHGRLFRWVKNQAIFLPSLERDRQSALRLPSPKTDWPIYNSRRTRRKSTVVLGCTIVIRKVSQHYEVVGVLLDAKLCSRRKWRLLRILALPLIPVPRNAHPQVES